MNSSSIEEILRGLSQVQATVLYWKCQGLNYVNIGERMNIAFQTVTREMAFVYDKLGPVIGIDKDTHWQTRKRILETVVCDALMHLIDGNLENLNKFPLGEADREPDPAILAMVLYDKSREEGAQEEPEFVTGEVVGEESIRNTRPILIVASIILCGLLLYGMRVLLPTFASTPPEPSNTPSQIIGSQGSGNSRPSATLSTSAAITLSLTPEITFTPTIPPTAVPLPIREDFSKQYSDLWRVMGSPILTENVPPTNWYSGVLTTRSGETGTLLIGNTGWTNYSVSFSGYGGGSNANVTIGVRVIDLNNMVVLDCVGWQRCSWVVVYEGKQDVITEMTDFFFRDYAIITVEGNAFTAIGDIPSNPTDHTMFFILPPEYQGKFDGGGVMVKVTDQISVDYIEIQSFPK